MAENMSLISEMIECYENSAGYMSLLVQASHENSYDDLKKLFTHIAESCGEDYDVYEGYSGRGMFGKKCWGIDGETAYKIVETAAQYGLTGAMMDSLGLGVIVYWPSIEYVR